MTDVSKFQVGLTYATRSAGDHDCIFSFEILDRTAKTVTVKVDGKAVRRGLYVYEGREQFRPFGRYALCPIIGADDAVGTVTVRVWTDFGIPSSRQFCGVHAHQSAMNFGHYCIRELGCMGFQLIDAQGVVCDTIGNIPSAA